MKEKEDKMQIFSKRKKIDKTSHFHFKRYKIALNMFLFEYEPNNFHHLERMCPVYIYDMHVLYAIKNTSIS